MSNTAIIIPCFNEEKRIISTSFINFLIQYESYALFFVDDGSTDKTYEKLQELKLKIPNRIEIIKNRKNIGKGESVRKGMIAAYEKRKFEQIGFLDADLSAPFSEFVLLTNFLLDNNKKAVFGSRLKKAGSKIDRSPIRHLIGRIVATFISWTIEIPFYDTQCGAKVFRCEVIDIIVSKPFVSRWLFDVEIILRLKKHWGSKIEIFLYEYPIQKWKQVDGSKIGFKDMFQIPFELIKIRKNR